MNWYVVYTKPKWEKKVAEQLTQRGIECYCPIVTEVRQWSDRKKKVEVPLFNSYVFVRLAEVDRNLVFQSSGVVRYLFWLAKPAIVRDEEISVAGDDVRALRRPMDRIFRSQPRVHRVRPLRGLLVEGVRGGAHDALTTPDRP